MRKILVVEVNWLGDCVMSLPVFSALKEKFRDSYIGVMCPERVKELFEIIPSVDEVIEFDEKDTHRGFLSKIRFIKELKKKRFDTAFLLHRSFTKALICKLANIKERIGFKRKKTKFLLTKRVKPQKNLHRRDYYFSLFEATGIPIKDKVPHLTLTSSLISLADKFFRKDDSFWIGINPSANWALKRWPLFHFVSLIKYLLKEDVKIVIVGQKKDQDIGEKLASLEKERIFNLCGKTILKELISVLNQIDLFISADSGPAHLSSALGKETVVLFGPTSPSITAPSGEKVHILRKDVGCKIPCYNLKCKDNICMKKITPEEVFLKIKEIMYEKD